MTSATMAALIYNTLKHPNIKENLIQELHEAQLSQPLSFLEVNNLPYLNAVIKESMHVFPTPT
jgi:cytochrome P450